MKEIVYELVDKMEFREKVPIINVLTNLKISDNTWEQLEPIQ